MTATDTATEPRLDRPDPSRNEPTGPRRRRPGPLAWIGGILGALILAIVIFLLLFNWDWFRPPLAKMLSARLHRPVRIVGHLRVHLLTWTPTVTLGGLQIGEPDWAPKTDLADFQTITVKMRLLSLLSVHVVLPLVELDQPRIAMFQDRNGRSNWDFSNGKQPGKPAKLPAIQNFVINDGKLAITSLQRKLQFSGMVNAHDSTTRGGADAGFHLGGAGQLNGKPFLMNVTGGPLLNVKPDVAYPFDAKVQAGDTVVTAKGQVPHPFNLGQIYADVSLKGRDLADIYYLTGVTLPNTPPYSIAGHLTRDEKVYQFQRFSGRVGGSDLEGNLKADMNRGNRPDLTGALVSRRLDYKDLGSLFGATGRNAPAAPHVAVVQPAPSAAGHRLLPDAPLDASRIRSMDADVTYKAETVVASANLPLKSVALGVKLDHGLLTLNPIRFQFPQGQLSGDASIDARNKVQRNAVDLRVSGIKMQQFLAAKGKVAAGPPPLEGTLDARARLTGDGDTVHKAAATSDGEVVAVIPGGVIRQAFAELLGINATKGLFELLDKDQHQTDIRCAVADFRVRNGVLQAQRIVLDTGVVLVRGSGDVDLNNETLNLTFTGDSKRFRLFHLDAPITIGGHLTSPAFGIKPAGPAIQAGIGAALGAVVFPPLALLPFIDPGLAKNANCASVMNTAVAAGAPVKRSQIVNAPHARAPH